MLFHGKKYSQAPNAEQGKSHFLISAFNFLPEIQQSYAMFDFLTEREFCITCDKWVRETSRLFHLKPKE